MTRPINVSTAALLDDPVVNPVILVNLKLESETIRLTSSRTDITFNSETYVANGWVMPPDGISESTDVGNYGFDLVLSGVNLALVSAILNNSNRGDPGTVYLALVTSSNVIVGQPVTLYRGIIDSCEIEDKIETSYVTIHLENDLARFDTSQNFRFTPESQSAYFPDDSGFQYVSQLENWTGFWGRPERPKWLSRQKSKKKS